MDGERKGREEEIEEEEEQPQVLKKAAASCAARRFHEILWPVPVDCKSADWPDMAAGAF